MLQENPIRTIFLASYDTLVYEREFVRYLLRTVEQEGGESLLVACGHVKPENLSFDELEWVAFPEFDLPLMQGLNIKRLLTHVKHFAPSLFHCLDEDCLGLANTLASNLEVNVIANVNRLQTRRTQLNISHRHCHALVVPCATIKASVIRLHQRYADRVIQIPPWMGVPEGKSEERVPKERIPSLVVIANRGRHKGLLALMRCLQELRQLDLPFMVAMLTTGESEFYLREWLPQYGLAEVVTLVSEIQFWHHVVASSDALVVPDPMLGYDPKLIEAMRLGLPVVACAGGVDDWLISGETAWTFKSGDTQAMMAALRGLLEDPNDACRLGMTGLQYIHALALQTQANEDSWLKMYQELATPITGLEVLV